ncbi:hypothetical protein [Alkalihalobacillus sp. TS-13]|uniref:hypothetical protein n=1 Tax=Alkalihalobacillus sp. TS-13 TaxID=2842455 RepID=UPI001C880BBC|nr:hypothetical protein [Alkalihalobacillus sp. TS-13]
MRNLVVILMVFFTFTLIGCGRNELGINLEKMETAVVDKAMLDHGVKKGKYTRSDIGIVSICKVVRKTPTKVPQHYIVHWQTSDGQEWDMETMIMEVYNVRNGETEYIPDGHSDYYIKTNECIYY